MKNKKLILGMAIILAILIAVFTGIFILSKPKTEKGSKEIEVTVVFADKSEKNFEIHTDAEYLSDALLEEKIITEKSINGMYTIIAGERADYNLDKSWWCLSKDGKMTNFGINDHPISDGDSFEITNTPS